MAKSWKERLGWGPRAAAIAIYAPASSGDEVQRRLHDEAFWSTMAPESFSQFLVEALLYYGCTGRADDIPRLNALYEHAVATLDPVTRREQVLAAGTAGERARAHCFLYLPALVVDPDESVVSSATIGMVMLSAAMDDGSPRAFGELGPLFERRRFKNPGAVFGGLVALGDRRFHPFLERLKPHLAEEDVSTAARIRTGFLTHGQVEFWLRWCEELAPRHDRQSEALFGRVASAMGLMLRGRVTGVVTDVERRYPCFDPEGQAVVTLETVGFDDYAKRIAPRLYAIEAAEQPPRVFADVLKMWGFEPAAPASEAATFPVARDGDTSFRDRLRTQFGVNWSIGAGRPTDDDPLELLNQDPRAALFTALQVIDLVCEEAGRPWRCRDVRWGTRDGRALLMIAVEQAIREGDEARFEPHEFVFDPHHVALAPGAPWPDAVIRDPLGLALPHGLGWMHLTGVQNLDAYAPGAGSSYGYHAPGIVGTLIVYPHGQGSVPILDDLLVTSEVARAVDEVTAVHPESRLRDPLLSTGANGMGYWEVRGVTGQGAYTVLCLTVGPTAFLKLRLTFSTDTPKAIVHSALSAYLALAEVRTLN
jgi:hypothetical protein